MNWKQIGLSLVLADFAIFTGFAVYEYGYVAFFEMSMSNLITAQVFIDLCIALTIVLVWMWRDARAHGWSPIPYVLLTLTLGSIGPLVYLIRRAGIETEEAPELGAVRLAAAGRE